MRLAQLVRRRLGDAHVICSLHQSKRSARENQTLEIKTGHEDTSTTIDGSQDVLFRNLAVLEDELRVEIESELE